MNRNKKPGGGQLPRFCPPHTPRTPITYPARVINNNCNVVYVGNFKTNLNKLNVPK